MAIMLHAHSWDFIAPYFIQNYQVVAFDMSGMGDSDHRDQYSRSTYAEEIIAVANENQMSDQTILVAHSFGGQMALRAVAQYPDRFKGLVLVDSGVRHPQDLAAWGPQLDRWTKPKVYPSREVALSRFRLQPPQPCENQYIVDHIARHSIEFDNDSDGWVWKFDDELNARMSLSSELEADYAAANCKLALIYGANSEFFETKSAGYMKDKKSLLVVIELANAQHHLFLEQPLAFVDELCRVISAW